MMTRQAHDMAAMAAIVTGGGTSPGRVPSIGEAIGRLLARRGVRVAVADIHRDAAERTVETIRAEGGEAIAVIADLRREAECASVVEATVRAFGASTS